MEVIYIYILSLIGLVYSSLGLKVKDYWIFLIYSVIFSYLIAIRSISEVPDTLGYANFFTSTNANSLSDIGYFSFEIGFQVFSKIIKLFIGDDPEYYFFIISLINSFLIFLSFRNFSKGKTENYYSVLFFLSYFVYFGLFYNAIVLRAGIAISLNIFGISILNKFENQKIPIKVYFLLFILILISLSFHLSSFISIVVILIYAFQRIKSIRFYRILFFLSVAFYFSKIGRFFLEYLLLFFNTLISFTGFHQLNRYLYYEDLLGNPSQSTSFRMLLFLSIGGIFAFSNKEWILKNIRIINIFFIGLVLSSLFSVIEQISRVTDYFLGFSIVLIWSYFISLRRIDSKLLFGSIVLFSQLYMVFRIINGV